MVVTALVVWPISVQIEVPDGTDEEDIREKLLEIARDEFEGFTIKPVIQDCSVESLIE